MNEKERILGLIAGSGKFPLIVLREAKKSGYSTVVVGIKNISSPELEKEADLFTWLNMGEVGKLADFFTKNNVKRAVLAGNVSHSSIYKEIKADSVAIELMKQLEDRKPTSIFKKLSEFLYTKGVLFIDSTIFLSNLLPEEGILTYTQPSDRAKEDIEFGWRIAKKIAGMDIGQTIVVKDKAVVAVEAMEGTNETLKRAIRIAGDGIVVIKVSRPEQDMSFDVPVVGASTIQILCEAKNSVLCVEAKKTLFFDMEDAIKIADENGISIVAKRE